MQSLLVIRGAHTACSILVKQLKHIDAALTMMMYTKYAANDDCDADDDDDQEGDDD